MQTTKIVWLELLENFDFRETWRYNIKLYDTKKRK